MFAVEAVIVSNGLRVTMSRPPSIRAHVLIAFKILLDCFPRPPVTTCECSIEAYASGEGRLVSWPVEAEVIGVILGP